MSVSSILAFVLAGVAFKTPLRDRPEEKPNRARYFELDIENGELRRRVEELEGDVARANIQYRRDQGLIDLWRERALADVPAVRPPLAQQNMQAAMDAHAQDFYGQGLAGMGFLVDAELWRNCVPSRSQAWAADRTG